MKKLVILIWMLFIAFFSYAQEYFVSWHNSVSYATGDAGSTIDEFSEAWTVKNGCGGSTSFILTRDGDFKIPSLPVALYYSVYEVSYSISGGKPTFNRYRLNYGFTFSNPNYGVINSYSINDNSIPDPSFCSLTGSNVSGTVEIGISPPQPSKIDINGNDTYVVAGETVTLGTPPPTPAPDTYVIETGYCYTATPSEGDWVTASTVTIPENTPYNTIYFRARVKRTGVPSSPVSYSPYGVQGFEIRKFPAVTIGTSAGICTHSQGSVSVSISNLNAEDKVLVFVGGQNKGQSGNGTLNMSFDHGDINVILYYCKKGISGDYSKFASKNCGIYNVPMGTGTAPTIPIITPSTLAVCEGSTANFSASSSGYTPLTYEWYRGGSLLVASNNLSLSGVTTASAGTYAVKVINHCGDAAASATLAVTPLPIINYLLSDPVVCKDQAYIITQSGSQTGVAYQLQNAVSFANVGSPIDGTGSAISFSVGASASTTYRVVATSKANASCSLAITNQAIVTVNNTPTANAGTELFTCQSSTPAPITLSGASVGGGATTGAWSIAPGGGGALSSTALTPLPNAVTYTPPTNFSGIVTLRLTSDFPAGCSAATSDRIITVSPTTIGGTASGSQEVCTGTAPLTDLTLTGHTGGVVKWQKSTNTNFIPCDDIIESTETLGASKIGILTATTYFRAIVQSGTCSPVPSDYATITVDPLTVVGSVSSDQTICENDIPSDIVISGHNGSVSWFSSLASNFSNPTELFENNAILKGSDIGSLSSTMYYRAMVKSGACPSSQSGVVKVTVNPTITASVLASTDITTICEGTSVKFTATPANGGATPSYQWLIFGDNVGTNSPVFETTILRNNNAVKVVMTVNGVSCLSSPTVVSNEIVMTVNPLKPASVSITASKSNICVGDAVTFTATPTNGGSTPAYQWKVNGSNAGTNSNTFTTSTLLNNDIVTVVMTSTATPCLTQSPATSNAISINVNALISPAGPISGSATACTGTIESYSTAAISGATSYIWNYTGTGVTFSGVTNPVSVTFVTNATSGNLTVKGSNGCGVGTVSNNFAVVVRTVPAQPSSIIGSTTPCSGSSQTYSVTDVPGVTYAWNFPPGWSKTAGGTSNSVTVTAGSSSGSITVTPSNGCGDGTPQSLPVSLLTIGSPAITHVSCNEGDNGAIAVTATGGVPSYTFAWTSLSGYTSSSEGIANLKADTYTLTLTDQTGCTSTSNYTVNQPAVPLGLSVKATVEPTCHGLSDGSIQLDSTGGWGKYTFKLQGTPDVINKTGLFTNLAHSDYTFSVTDKGGCSYEMPLYTLNEPPKLVVKEVNLTHLKCFEDGTGVVKVIADGGTPGYEYNFGSDFHEVDSIRDLQIGHYTFTIRDSKGCKTSGEGTITQPSKLKVIIGDGTIQECKDNVLVTPVGGTAPYNLLVNEETVPCPTTGYLVDKLPSGIYQITLTDRNSCSVSDEISLSSFPAPKIKLISVKDASCANISDGFIEVQPITQTSWVEVQWDDGFKGNIYSDLSPKTYHPVAKDKYGCTHDTTITVGSPPAIIISQAKKREPKCFGNPDGNLSVTASGRNPSDFRYVWYNMAQSKISETDSTGAIPSGEYKVVVSDLIGCSDTSYYSIIDPPTLQPNLPNLVTICSNQTYVADAGVPGTSFLWSSAGGYSATDRTATLTDAGIYTLLVTDAKGCSGRDTLTLVKSGGIIDANFIMADRACVGDTLVLIEVSWPIPEAIEWRYEASFVPIFSTNYSIYLVPQMTGNFSIGLTSHVGDCWAEIDRAIIVEPARVRDNQLVSKQSLIKDVVAFPNPNRGDFSVEVNLNQESDVLVEVYSVYGKRLYMTQGTGLSAYKVNINLLHNPGIYLVRITAGGEGRSLRVVVE